MSKHPKAKRRNGTGYAISTSALRKAQQQAQTRRITPANPAAIPRVRARKRG